MFADRHAGRNRRSDYLMVEVTKKKRRYNRKDWLATALEVLSGKGAARITIAGLCSELGVTKGSFYGHFEDREDFVKQLIQHWDLEFTQCIISELAGLQAQSAKERLRVLMRTIEDKQLARFDVAVRAWAAQDPEISKLAESVFQARFNSVKALMREMGLEGAELDMRVELFVVYYSSFPQRMLGLPETDRSSTLEERLELFSRID